VPSTVTSAILQAGGRAVRKKDGKYERWTMNDELKANGFQFIVHRPSFVVLSFF
jgi:hypothetical protein